MGYLNDSGVWSDPYDVYNVTDSGTCEDGQCVYGSGGGSYRAASYDFDSLITRDYSELIYWQKPEIAPTT